MGSSPLVATMLHDTASCPVTDSAAGKKSPFLLPRDESVLAIMWDAGVISNGKTLDLFPHCVMGHTPLTVCNRAAKVRNTHISVQLKSLVLVCFRESFGSHCSGNAFFTGTAYTLEKRGTLQKPNSWMCFDISSVLCGFKIIHEQLCWTCLGWN